MNISKKYTFRQNHTLQLDRWMCNGKVNDLTWLGFEETAFILTTKIYQYTAHTHTFHILHVFVYMYSVLCFFCSTSGIGFTSHLLICYIILLHALHHECIACIQYTCKAFTNLIRNMI